MKCRLFLLALISICQLLSVYGENIKIEDYSYKDGLTTSGVNSVYQDQKGFLWLCSNNGLFRFDGYTFRNINTIIKSNFSQDTYCITEDSDNNFLIGTRGGIYNYNTKNEKLYQIRLNLYNKCRIYKILVIDSKIWMASDSGLITISKQKIFNPDSVVQTKLLLPDSLHKRTPQDNIINTLFYSPGSSSLWVGTNGALYKLNLKTHTFQHINSFSQNSIRGISKYNNGIIASSWDGGIFFVDSSSHKLEKNLLIQDLNKIIGDKRVMSTLVDSQDRIWVATYGNGLYIFEKNISGTLSFVNYRNNKTHQQYLKSDFINQMYLDNIGIVWLSMSQPALSKVYFQNSNLIIYDFLRQKNNDTKEILAVNQSNDKSKLWVATNGAGIFLFDTENYTLKQFNDQISKGLRLQNNDVNLCYQDKRGNLWIVYRRTGLYVVPSEKAKGLLTGDSKMVKPVDANSLVTSDNRLNSYITLFYEDSSGRLWIGGWGLLYIIDLNNDLFESKTINVYLDYYKDGVNFPISPVYSIIERDRNRYWIGTLGSGIIQFDEVSKYKFSGSQLAINEKIPTQNIKFMHKDKKNNLWIGTNSGLCHLNLNTNKLKLITVKNGLTSDNTNSITEDNDSNIWVSTSYGISEINSDGTRIQNFFHTVDGNYDQYILNAASLTSNGLVCFSTNNALIMVNPDSIRIDRPYAPLYFTDIKIDNETILPFEKYYGTIVIAESINECKAINVPYNHTLSIEFAALDFANPDRLLYKYRIGKNSEWLLLNSNQRSLSIPNLKYGKYTLSVKLANSPDEKNIQNIQINYLPPFWLTKTAYILYFLFILVLIFVYRRLIIQKTRQKSILEKEQFERKKIEELDKMKSEFFSNISHEFRTPLSLIIDPLEKLIKDEDISQKNKDKIKLILKSSNRLLKLTNELIDFGKIEKKSLKPDFQPCEIISFVNELCQLFNNLTTSMNLDFKVHYSFDKLEIPIDKGMIEKVIFNLLSNAFKYTPANGLVKVNVSKSTEDESEYVRISVINTGEGISSENLEYIFDRYYRVNNVRNRYIEGTGLGLAIVKSFVELHNGKVSVKSEPNFETCFDIYLPVVQENFTNSFQFDNVETGKTFKDLIISGKTDKISKPVVKHQLLIIEDEEDVRNYIIDELSSEFKILSAKNGEEGFEIANEVIPDLIITDSMMPGQSGLELCKKLKNQVTTSHIPILILSAKTSVEHQIEGLELGADAYMVKPFNIDHLKAQILRMICFKEVLYSQYNNGKSLVPQGTLSNKLDEAFMKKVMAFIEENITNTDLNVDQLANCVSLSKVQTYRKIKAISGLSVVEFIREIRLKKAAQMISEGNLYFSQVAFETGFSSPSYFSKCFHDHFGKTPSEFASG